MPTKTSMRSRLQEYGLSERQAKSAVARWARVMNFRELTALFEGDPTGLVAVLRVDGYIVDPRYAQPRMVAQ